MNIKQKNSIYVGLVLFVLFLVLFYNIRLGFFVFDLRGSTLDSITFNFMIIFTGCFFLIMGVISLIFIVMYYKSKIGVELY